MNKLSFCVEEDPEQQRLTGANKQNSQNHLIPVIDQGEGSSVAAAISKERRQYYTMRAAIDEKFVPRSIKNLRLAAYLIFFVLISLSSKYQEFTLVVLFFVVKQSLFNRINDNI